MGTIAYEIYPLTPERWDDFTALFGAHGAVGGCWCMYWRREGAWQGKNGDANREQMRALVQGGAVTGLLAYAGGQAVGWVSVAPRGDYSALARSRVLAPVDEQPVWSIVCFFIRRGWPAGNGEKQQSSWRPEALTNISAQNGGQLVHRLLAGGIVAGFQHMFAQMAVHQFSGQAVNRTTNRRQLLQHISASGICQQGPLQRLHLPGQAAHSRQQFGLVTLGMRHGGLRQVII